MQADATGEQYQCGDQGATAEADTLQEQDMHNRGAAAESNDNGEQ